MKAVEEGKMKNKSKKPIRVVGFQGSNKNTNGSHGTFCVSLFCVLLAAKMGSN